MLVRLVDYFSPARESADERKFSEILRILSTFKPPNPSILSIVLWAKCRTDRLSSPSRF